MIILLMEKWKRYEFNWKICFEKNVRTYLDKKIGNNAVLCWNIEKVNEGFIYFKDDKNVFIF